VSDLYIYQNARCSNNNNNNNNKNNNNNINNNNKNKNSTVTDKFTASVFGVEYVS